MNNRIAKCFVIYIARHKTHVSWPQLSNFSVHSCTCHERVMAHFSPICVPTGSQSSKMFINQNSVCMFPPLELTKRTCYKRTTVNRIFYPL